MTNEITTVSDSLFVPKGMQELHELATIIAKSGMVPACYKKKDGLPNIDSIKVAIIHGSSIGIGPIQAIQNIYVVNGIPALWGDLPLALVKVHPQYVDVFEEPIKDGWRCTAKRKGSSDVVREFTRDEAKKAGLLGKSGPWSQHESRMIQRKARGRALIDQFPDVFKGLRIAEDYIDVRMDETERAAEGPADKLRRLKDGVNEPTEVNPSGESSDAAIEPSEPTHEATQIDGIRHSIDLMVEFLKETGRTFTDKETKRLKELNSVSELEKAHEYYRQEITNYEKETGEVFLGEGTPNE